MIILFKNQENACLNELSNRFPELLAIAQINLSNHGQQKLHELVRARIKSNYFPSFTDSLATILGAFLLFPLFVMAFSNKAVSTLDTHSEQLSTPELKNIASEKINLLDGLIHTHILDHYRDHAEEARFAAEAAKMRENRTIDPVAPRINRYAPQLPQYAAHRIAPNRSYKALVLSFILTILLLNAIMAAADTKLNTCPAPRF